VRGTLSCRDVKESLTGLVNGVCGLFLFCCVVGVGPSVSLGAVHDRRQNGGGTDGCSRFITQVGAERGVRRADAAGTRAACVVVLL
jgi:hypothetical protein